MSDFSQLQTSIGISFKNKSLLAQAFIHRSYLNENRGKKLQSNERLEFLGDAVLELATSEFLFQKLTHQPEGELTSLRSSLVKTGTLASTADKLKLGSYLKMSRGEAAGGGKTNETLLANTFEALIGAIYLDQDFTQAEKFLNTYLFPQLKTILENNLHHDFKSTLQEKVQAQGQPTPQYQTVKAIGPDHQKIFTITVLINGKIMGRGQGSSKQRAQQDAAQAALKKLKL